MSAPLQLTGATWTAEEMAWALECACAGDTFEEIAAWSERTTVDVACALRLAPMTDAQRQVASLWATGATHTEIGALTGKSHGYSGYVIGKLRAAGYPIPDRAQTRRDEPVVHDSEGWRRRLERNRMIAARLAAGERQADLHRELGVSRHVLSGLAMRMREAAGGAA